MQRRMSSGGMVTSCAMAGVVVGLAAGMVSTYAVAGNKTKLRKSIKKVERKAVRTLANVERMMNK